MFTKVNIVRKNFLFKNFSIFSRIKKHSKSEEVAGAQVFKNMKNPDEIKIEIDEPSKENLAIAKNKKNSKGLTERELEILKNLPKETIKYQNEFKYEPIQEKEYKLIEDLLNNIEKGTATSQTKNQLDFNVRMKTIWDRLDTYQINNQGKVELPLVFENSATKVFENMEEYMKWKTETTRNLQEEIKAKLTPMEYYLTQNKGTERPYTGDYWDNNHPGVYSCKVCTLRIFSSTHKYDSKIGHATFWNFLPNTLNFSEDFLDYPQPTQAILKLEVANSKPVKRICCSNCDSHLGFLFNDGPAPFFKRLNINSSGLQFIDLGWFESPDIKKRRIELQKLIEEQREITKKNSVIQFMKKGANEMFDYIDNFVVPFEESLTLDRLSQEVEKKESKNKI